MDRIAFINGNSILYWSSIVLVLAAAVAICLFLAFFLVSRGNPAAGAVAVPMALVLSLLFSRITHWYFCADSYSGFRSALTNFSSGGFALLGVFFGCGLTAVILWASGLEKRLSVTLDAMSLGGCGGIALGRLSCLFSTADRGQLLENFRTLPWAYPVNNAVTGAQEYRLATFMLQAMAAALIFWVLAAFFVLVRRKKGDVTLLFLLFYGMSQAILDSTRYDSLFMRSNGFVSIVQVLGAAAMVVVCGIFSVQLVKCRGFRPGFLALWLGIAGLLGGAGYMEYYVQRHGNLALFGYSLMAACLSGAVILTIVIYILRGAGKPPRYQRRRKRLVSISRR